MWTSSAAPGADIVTCHVEADTQENILAAIDKIHAKGKKAGVVVKPRDPCQCRAALY